MLRSKTFDLGGIAGGRSPRRSRWARTMPASVLFSLVVAGCGARASDLSTSSDGEFAARAPLPWENGSIDFMLYRRKPERRARSDELTAVEAAAAQVLRAIVDPRSSIESRTASRTASRPESRRLSDEHGGATHEGPDDLLPASLEILAMLGDGSSIRGGPFATRVYDATFFIIAELRARRKPPNDSSLGLSRAIATTALGEAYLMAPSGFLRDTALQAYVDITDAAQSAAEQRGGAGRLRRDEALALAWCVPAAINALIAGPPFNPVGATRLLRLAAGLSDYGPGRRTADSSDPIIDEIRSGGALARLFLAANGHRVPGDEEVPADLVDRSTFDPAAAAQVLRAALIYQATGDDLASECRSLLARAVGSPADDAAQVGSDVLYGGEALPAARVLIMLTAKRHLRWFKRVRSVDVAAPDEGRSLDE